MVKVWSLVPEVAPGSCTGDASHLCSLLSRLSSCLLQSRSHECSQGHLSGRLKELIGEQFLKGWAIDGTQELCIGTKPVTAASIP